jgi:hypothetical protein
MKFLKSALAVFPFLIACGLSSGNIQSKQATDLDARRIRRIAVIPPVPRPAAGAAKSALPGEPSEKRAEAQDPDEVIFRLLYSAMFTLPAWQIVSENEVRDAANSVAPADGISRLRKIGEQVYADAVLTGRILRYRERVGGDIGVKTPASVAFILDLVDVQRADVVWSARFDETQKGLSENILALGDIHERGIRWLTAEQLAQDGVRKTVHQLHQAIVHGRGP